MRGKVTVSCPTVHDLNYFREHLADFERMAANRGVRIDFEAFRALDRARRELITLTERRKAERNKAGEEIARRKRAGEKADDLLAEMKRVSDEVKRADEEITRLDAQSQDFMLSVPNLPHASVPIGHDARSNVEVRRWGRPPQFDFAPKPHWDVGERAGILDLEREHAMEKLRVAERHGVLGLGRWHRRQVIPLRVQTPDGIGEADLRQRQANDADRPRDATDSAGLSDRRLGKSDR